MGQADGPVRERQRPGRQVPHRRVTALLEDNSSSIPRDLCRSHNSLSALVEMQQAPPGKEQIPNMWEFAPRLNATRTGGVPGETLRMYRSFLAVKHKRLRKL